MTFQPSAKIIADSINTSGNRITTFEVKLHRFVLAEFNTHRVNSRNFQSSRACPVEKMIANIVDDDVFPLHWGKNQKGMVANQEVDEQTKIDAKIIWSNARAQAIKHTRMLIDIGIHKQVANRLLEPFMAITGIVTATDYDNFFAQRCHSDSQPEIRALADAMREAYKASVPEKLNAGEWHLPFIKSEDWADFHDKNITHDDLLRIATGRCARVSYLNHNGVRHFDDDIALHDRLLASQPPHLSPFEHCAIANDGKFANFTGWQSYRNILETSHKA